MQSKIIRSLGLIIGLALIVSCRGTVQIGVEQTPTPDRSIPATLASLREENSRLATRVAAQSVDIPTTLDLGRLAFVQGGDIWIVPVFDEAARPHRLTIDGYNREPRWSPSGRWLAYRKERSFTVAAPANATGAGVVAVRRQVWLIQADGNSEHPINQGLAVEAAVWSPTADRLAYTTSAGGLSIINADGTDLVTLVAEDTARPFSDRQLGSIYWSPDGKWIAYEQSIQTASPPNVQQGLWRVSSGGGEPIELCSTSVLTNSAIVLVGWSALGDQILAIQDQSTALSNFSPVDGGQLYAASMDAQSHMDCKLTRVDEDSVLPYADFVVRNPLSADWQGGRTMALVAGEGRRTWTHKRIKSAGQYLTSEDLAAISPAWSPDGNRLAFVAMPDRSELVSSDSTVLMQRRIWIADAFGDPKPRALTSSNGYRDERPLWSADGRYLLFARLDTNGRASVWFISSVGGTPQQIVDELTPAPDPLESFGHVDWKTYYDWWRGL